MLVALAMRPFKTIDLLSTIASPAVRCHANNDEHEKYDDDKLHGDFLSDSSCFLALQELLHEVKCRNLAFTVYCCSTIPMAVWLQRWRDRMEGCGGQTLVPSSQVPERDDPSAPRAVTPLAARERDNTRNSNSRTFSIS